MGRKFGLYLRTVQAGEHGGNYGGNNSFYQSLKTQYRICFMCITPICSIAPPATNEINNLCSIFQGRFCICCSRVASPDSPPACGTCFSRFCSWASIQRIDAQAFTCLPERSTCRQPAMPYNCLLDRGRRPAIRTRQKGVSGIL